MLPDLKQQSNLELRISLTSYSILPSSSIGGRGLFSVGERVQKGRSKLGDVEHRVDPSELLWEVDCNGVCTWGTYYLEWSQVFLC